MDKEIIRNALQAAYDVAEGSYEDFKEEFERLQGYWVPKYISEDGYLELFEAFFPSKASGDSTGYELDEDEFEAEFVNGVTLSKLPLQGWFDESALANAEAIPFCERFLKTRFGLKGQIRTDIVRNAAHILTRLNDPLNWKSNKNGLVYGMVQSGKTNSMLALTTLAFYKGYDIVIVLTTSSIDLRNQTQVRFGNLFDLKQGISECEGMKIRTSTAESDKVPPRSDPYDYFNGVEIAHDNSRFKQFLVLKKDTHTLKKHVRMFEELVNRLQENKCSPKFLILDDEADHSSLNTNRNELSTINRHLTSMVERLGHVDYVAYTATPQGCIAADVNAKVGYPRDFIWVLEPFLPRENNKVMMGSYVGGYEVFHKFPNRVCESIPNEDWPLHLKDRDGTYNGVYTPLPESQGGSLKQAEADYVNAILSNRMEVPDSMIRLLMDFIITGAERWRTWYHASNLDKPFHEALPDAPYFACLFNPTYISNTQINYAKVVDLAWQLAKEACAGESKSFLKRVHDHERVAMSMSKRFEFDADLKEFITHFIREVDRTIFIRDTRSTAIQNSGEYLYVLNSKTPFNLDYTKKDQTAVKRAAIVIGGNKLSRGLTIEGLACAYYGRTQRVSLADTVTQMARWFGHKASYLHLMRVYLHDDTFEAFREISYEDLRLRLAIKRSIIDGDSPKETIFEILQSPLYKATNPTKARHLKSSGRSDYSRNAAMHKRFRQDASSLLHNVAAFDQFLAALRKSKGDAQRVWNRGDAWFQVKMDEVVRFFANMTEADYETESSPRMLVRYLEHWRKEVGEVSFNVVHMRPEKGGLPKRKRKGVPDSGTEQEIKKLVSNEFESLTGSIPERNYLGDRFIDFANHEGKSRMDLQKERKRPLLLLYELDPNYISKPALSYVPGDARYIDLAGRGIIVYAMMMPSLNRPRLKGLVNSTISAQD